MERLPTIFTILLLASSALVVAGPALGQGTVQAKVTALHAAYGPETWKDQNATVGSYLVGSPVPSLPAGGLGVYQNPYSAFGPHQGPGVNYLGYALSAVVQLQAGSGQSLPSGSNYVIGAKLTSAAGSVPVKLTKLASDRFRIRADLDGEDGQSFPALTVGGDATLQITVYQVPQDPTVNPQQVASITQVIHLHRGSLSPAGILFPDSHLPGYDDVSATNLSVLQPSVSAPDAPIHASLDFPGASSSPVAVDLVNGATVMEIYNGTTDANGTVQVSFKPSVALNGTDAGLLVLQGNLRGSMAADLGSAAVVLPISANPMPVTAITYQQRSGPNAAVSQNLSMVQVTVKDPNTGPNNDSKMGTLDLLSGVHVFYNASFQPQGFLPGQPRSTTFQGNVVTGHHLTTYRILAFFVDGQNRFYGLATATRGASATAPDVQAKPSATSNLVVKLENLDDNGNGQVDTGLLLPVHVVATGLPGKANATADITVPEGGTGSVSLPFVAPSSGSQTVHVTVYAGEMVLHLSPTVSAQASSTGPLGLPTSLSDIPGPSLPALLAAAGAALVVLGIRRRS